MKRVSVLGATGSIGQNTIDLLARRPGDFHVVALTGGRNLERLAEDAKRIGAELAVTADPDGFEELRVRLAGSNVEAAAGPKALLEAAARPADWSPASKP